MTLPEDRDLTADEIKQLIASNSRAIMANSEAIAQTNRNIDRLENNVSAASDAVFQLASLMQRFFASQIETNATLEDRINRLDPQN
jgi:hypothetical protein